MERVHRSTSPSWEVMPDELRKLRRWVVWKLEPRPDKNGKTRLEKVPYCARTRCKAAVDDAKTWATFEEAVAALGDGKFAGIGFVFVEADGLVFIDLDKCIHAATEELNSFARFVLDTVPGYTEVSQSGTGLHIVVRGRRPGKRCKDKKHGLEMYSTGRFCAMTGDVLEGRTTISRCDEGLLAVYECVWPNAEKLTKRAPWAKNSLSEWSDEEVFERAHEAGDGVLFERLWAGEWEDNYGSQSEADAALCACLMRACEGDEEQVDRLFRSSGLMREKWDESRGERTYGERTIGHVLATYQPTQKQPQDAQVTLHLRPWLQSEETDEERKQKLQRTAKEAVKQALRRPKTWSQAVEVRVIALPPGTGKTHQIAEAGRPTHAHPQGKTNIGLIVERRNQAEQVNFQGWHIQRGCDASNCPDGWQLHQALAALGYNTAGIHKAHNCPYWQQMEREGSTVYQVEHVGTAYVREHQVYIIDEFNLPKWIPAENFGASTLMAAAKKFDESNDAFRLLQAMTQVVGWARGKIQGKALFDALDRQCDGALSALVSGLAGRDKEMRERPYADVEAPEAIAQLPPVVLPKLVRVLVAELGKWETGSDWNSRVRVVKQGTEWKLCISEKRFMRAGRQVCVMDATADAEILQRFFGRQVRLLREDVEPMRGTRFIWLKMARYGKSTLVTGTNREHDVQRAVKRVRWALRQYAAPNSSVGLISFKGKDEAKSDKTFLDQLGDEISIPENTEERKWRLNYWGQRGSNDLSNVDILVVVGTPAWNPEDVARMGRVLYADDDLPIDETFESGRYVDNRLQHISDHLTQAELTQAVHRNRTLRYHDKTVILLSNVTVDFLPATHEVTHLPALAEDGRLRTDERRASSEERMDGAVVRLESEGRPLTRRSLAKEAGVRAATAAAYLQRRAGAA